jgi:hypothetical protein
MLFSILLVMGRVVARVMVMVMLLRDPCAWKWVVDIHCVLVTC